MAYNNTFRFSVLWPVTGVAGLFCVVADPSTSSGQASSAARVIGEFAKGHDKLVVKAVSISGKLLPASDLEALAKMPTYDQAISMLMSVMQAPISKFVRTLAEPHAKLARTIAAIRDQKQAA